ncbi:uncharacterized protein Dvir_GJ27032 [Drosophila virilis]|uniref:Uncharacterized protein n=1 Tax=Drosophila virilis TaxID=7244 RepID=A0A0Q9WIC5_DROVI|nr:uncharacterized protein Dvir_GJ27032 [Drosophila virilis]
MSHLNGQSVFIPENSLQPVAVVIFAILARAAAATGLFEEQSTYTAPTVAATPDAVVVTPAPYVTATGSQLFAGDYNVIALEPVVAAAPGIQFCFLEYG